MIEENKIKDAEIIIEDIAEISGEKKHDNLYIEKALILILGILIGIAVKTEALNKITIGFDDYLMMSYEQDYDLNKMEDEQIKKMMEEQAELENQIEDQH